MWLYLATNQGLIITKQSQTSWTVVDRVLTEHHVTSVVAREGVILAGTTKGIFRSEDNGSHWQPASEGVSHGHIRWLAFHPDISDCEFAGTEPAAIYLSQNGGESWQERPEVAALRNQFGWWMPYSPEAGCVRGFAFHGKRAYAAVEVGGLLRSDDGGHTWDLAPGSNGHPQFGVPRDGNLHADIHSVEVHPLSADQVWAPSSGGFFGSEDGGVSWRLLYPNCYARAVWVCPVNPLRMVLGPAENSSGQNGRIEVSEDGGQSWQKTNVSWSRNMVERFKPLNPNLFAVLANGQLLQTPVPDEHANLAALNWTQILPEVRRINDVTMMVI